MVLSASIVFERCNMIVEEGSQAKTSYAVSIMVLCQMLKNHLTIIITYFSNQMLYEMCCLL